MDLDTEAANLTSGSGASGRAIRQPATYSTLSWGSDDESQHRRIPGAAPARSARCAPRRNRCNSRSAPASSSSGHPTIRSRSRPPRSCATSASRLSIRANSDRADLIADQYSARLPMSSSANWRYRPPRARPAIAAFGHRHRGEPARQSRAAGQQPEHPGHLPSRPGRGLADNGCGIEFVSGALTRGGQSCPG